MIFNEKLAAARQSNVDYEDCEECAEDVGSGICSNCEDDGGYCPECEATGRCQECEGSGRVAITPDPAWTAEVEAAGPLIPPEEEAS